MFEETITLGEVLGILFTAILGLGVYGWRRCRKAFPFRMRFSEQPTYMDTSQQRIFRDVYETGLGKRRVCLEILTNEAIKLERFDIRLMQRTFGRFGSPVPARQRGVKLVTIDCPAMKKVYRRDDVTWEGVVVEDEYGGLEFNVGKVWEWCVGDPLWIEIEIEATEQWVGVISFRARTDRQATARRRICFWDK